MVGRFRALILLIGLLISGFGPPPPSERSTAALFAWVELGPNGSAVARAITDQGICPTIVLDTGAQPMRVRAASTPDYPILVCEAAIPIGTRSAAVGERPLALPKPAPRRIVVLGDTGCRMKAGHEFQACNDPEAWPFAQIVASAAAWQPDLVIHSGDYLYRELACPPDNSGCAGSPWGYNWATWEADFFAPAGPLLRAAPWVVARGDHELCSRAGGGYIRFLDPRPLAECFDFTQPYTIPLGDVRLLIMDTVDADDNTPVPEQVAAYARQFADLREMTSANTWLVMHKPLWAVRPGAAVDGSPRVLHELNPTLQAASGNTLPPGISRVISGHIHLFEALSFADGRPPQFVVGTGGTSLDPEITTPLPGLEVGGTTVTAGTLIVGFGFTTLEATADDWVMTWRDLDGVPRTTCRSRGASLICTP